MTFLFHISAVLHPLVSFSCREVEVLKEKFPFVVNEFFADIFDVEMLQF